MEIKIKAIDAFEAFKAVVLAASREEDREHMNCVLVEIEGSTIRTVATNGHWLAKWEAPGVVVETDRDGSLSIPLPIVKILLKTIKPMVRSMPGAPVTIRDGELEFPGGSLSFATVTDKFPPWRKTIPTPNGSAPSCVGLDTKYLKDVSASFRVRVTGQESAPIVMQLTGELDPILITSEQVRELTVIVMPIRIESERYAATKKAAKKAVKSALKKAA